MQCCEQLSCVVKHTCGCLVHLLFSQTCKVLRPWMLFRVTTYLTIWCLHAHVTVSCSESFLPWKFPTIWYLMSQESAYELLPYQSSTILWWLCDWNTRHNNLRFLRVIDVIFFPLQDHKDGEGFCKALWEEGHAYINAWSGCSRQNKYPSSKHVVCMCTQYFPCEVIWNIL